MTYKGVVWNDNSVEKKRWYNGIDRVVVYYDNPVVEHGYVNRTWVYAPWDGVTSVSIAGKDREQITRYYMGERYASSLEIGGISVEINAFAYPDEILNRIGMYDYGSGVIYDEGVSRYFSMCYRTMVNGDKSQIHVLFNVLLSPSSVSNVTISDNPSIMEFKWTGDVIPERIDGNNISHIVLDEATMDASLFKTFEMYLYGNEENEPDFGMVRMLLRLMRRDDLDFVVIPSKSENLYTLLSFSNLVGSLDVGYIDAQLKIFEDTKNPSNWRELGKKSPFVSDTVSDDLKKNPNVKILKGVWIELNIKTLVNYQLVVDTKTGVYELFKEGS